MKKIVLVVGSEGRIGSSLINSLKQNNYFVIAVDKKKTNKSKEKNILKIKCNFEKKNSIKKLFTNIKKVGKVYAAVNCLYPKNKTWGTNFEKLDEKKVTNHLYLQLGLPILISKEICKHFITNGSGKLVNISSVQGISTPKFEHYKNTKIISPLEYSIAKSGIISLTRYLAKYYKKKNITVNCVSPGGIKSNQPINFKNKYKKACNSKGLLDAIDVVHTIMFLISENSKYITGQNIIVDDGWSL